MAQLKRHTHGPEFWARLDGTCPLCPEPIVRGESVVVVVDNLGTCHALCGVNYCRVLDEELPEDER